MRSLLIFAGIIASIQLDAQPVIQDPTNLPTIGYSYGFLMSNCSDPGLPGVDQTWDYSAYPFSPLGTISVVDPSSTSMGTTFSTSNWAYQVGTFYSYFISSPTELVEFAETISSSNNAGDYSADPKKILQYPFSFGDNFTDSYVEMSMPTTITVTYDGYGTILLPGHTYTNVVRVHEDIGTLSTYRWYTLDPLMSVAVYREGDNSIYWVSQPEDLGFSEQTKNAITLRPNPASESLELQLGQVNESKEIVIYAMDGQEVLRQSISPNSATEKVFIANLKNGMYCAKIGEEFLKFVKQ